jgi:hypothetical protein
MLHGLRGSNVSSSSGSSSLLRLYQLLPPRLAARAALFGSSLSISDDWKQLEPGFFSAPGAQYCYNLDSSTAVQEVAALCWVWLGVVRRG